MTVKAKPKPKRVRRKRAKVIVGSPADNIYTRSRNGDSRKVVRK